MKTPIIFGFFLLSISLAWSDEPEKSEFVQTVEKNWWRTIQIGTYDFVGDYFVEGPFLYFQRLPDKRILLSSIAASGKGAGQPFPVRFVTDGDEIQGLAFRFCGHEKTRSPKNGRTVAIAEFRRLIRLSKLGLTR